MSDVVKLLPNNALCVDQADIAARVRRLADRIEAGEFGKVERCVIVVENETNKVPAYTYGRPTTTLELVGLLEYAKREVM